MNLHLLLVQRALNYSIELNTKKKNKTSEVHLPIVSIVENTMLNRLNDVNAIHH